MENNSTQVEEKPFTIWFSGYREQLNQGGIAFDTTEMQNHFKQLSLDLSRPVDVDLGTEGVWRFENGELIGAAPEENYEPTEI